ncbi:G-protein coupled receptor GRL101-like [Littorina saxatilis]|uniref:G-protein coupled receptor GRL101-like n=1 Tax=Littorina saxatilis TaxID=31220 RepID=UPI0038B4852F
MWTDNTAAYFVNYTTEVASRRFFCGYFGEWEYDRIMLNQMCQDPTHHFPVIPLCERRSADKPDKQPNANITLHHPRNRKWPVSYSPCSEGHTTLSFLSCDSSSREAYVSESIISGSARRTIGDGGGPYFRCDNEVQRLPYTLVCDHRQDCADHSDEDFCHFPPCTGDTPLTCGTYHQCIPIDQLCNGQNDCYNGEDELECISVISLDPPLGKYVAIPPPAVVHFDPTANTTSAVTMTTLIPSSGSNTCPDTHFQCPGGGYCMPVFVRCNGVNDCPGHEDEEGCDTYTCPGFYRCRNSRICLHADHVCDGLYHCPLQDDERYCHIHCPTNCTCYGFAFTCPRVFPVLQFPDLRYLDASDSGVSLQHLTHNVMLIHLGVARCGLTDLGNVTLPNLQSLDLSDNQVVSVSTGDLSLFPNIGELYLSGNPLTSLLPTDANRSIVFPLIHTLDVELQAVLSFDATSKLQSKQLLVTFQAPTCGKTAPGDTVSPARWLASCLSLSCEVSAFIVCFITLDRFLALRFPFSGFHFSSKASHMVCAATWLLGVGVAAIHIPLLPATSHWQFYSQTGICIPLPVTRNDFTGQNYSFGVMIVLNFVLFVLMAVGQVFIYTSIQSSRMSLGPDSSRKEQDVNIARRLITIAVTDFLCCVPIGLLGLLASMGVAVPGEVNVAMAIPVLPLNSALNSFLYSLNMLLERRRRAREQHLLQALEAQLLSEN